MPRCVARLLILEFSVGARLMELDCFCGEGFFLIRKRKSDGHKFYGCTTYPKCKETVSLSEFDTLGAIALGEHPWEDY